METSHSTARRKGRDIARAHLRKQKIRGLIIGLLVGLFFALAVGLILWKVSRR